MGYSDQKYHSRPLHELADSGVATGTYTASSTAAVGVAFTLPTFTRASRINSGKLLVKTAPTTGQSVISFVNGTTTFATSTISSTASAGTVIALTMTNTALTSTSTVTNTLPNGSTTVGTITTTTDYRMFAAAGQPTVAVAGTATASGNTYGTFEFFAEVQETPA